MANDDFTIHDIPAFKDFVAVSALSMLSHDYWYNEEINIIAKRCYGIAEAFVAEREERNATKG